VEAGRPGRDPAEAIRAMEAELEERRRIEAMLKVGYNLYLGLNCPNINFLNFIFLKTLILHI
jgi:hypothetical protein